MTAQPQRGTWPEEVGRRVRRAREAAGLTQFELVMALGPDEVSLPTLQRIESGKQKAGPSAEQLVRIAAALDVPTTNLMPDASYLTPHDEPPARKPSKKRPQRRGRTSWSEHSRVSAGQTGRVGAKEVA